MADQELNVAVVDVTSNSGVSKKTNKPYTIYEVTLSDGNVYKTFKNEVGTKAQQAKGQQVTATVHTETGAWGDSFFVDDIVAQGVPAGNGAEPIQVNDTVAPKSFNQTVVTSREEEIRRQFALKAAANYVTHNGTGVAETDLGTILELARHFYTAALEGPAVLSGEVAPATITW